MQNLTVKSRNWTLTVHQYVFENKYKIYHTQHLYCYEYYLLAPAPKTLDSELWRYCWDSNFQIKKYEVPIPDYRNKRNRNLVFFYLSIHNFDFIGSVFIGSGSSARHIAMLNACMLYICSCYVCMYICMHAHIHTCMLCMYV